MLCSLCGKETTVPFEPEEGRPVYCQDCLKKIKSGEARPVSIPRANPQRSLQQKSRKALAALGIEFDDMGGEEMFGGDEKSEFTPQEKKLFREPTNTYAKQRTVSGGSRAHSPQSLQRAQGQHSKMQKQPERNPEPHDEEPTIKLRDVIARGEIKPKETVQPKESGDVSELRNAIQEALKNLHKDE